MNLTTARGLVLLALLLVPLSVIGQDTPDATVGADWVAVDEQGETRILIHLFWSRTCPHCAKALHWLAQIQSQQPWIQVREYELGADRAHVERYVTMARALGEEARSVPAFLVCGHMITGFDHAQGVGAQVLAWARLCAGDNGLDAAAEELSASRTPSQVQLPLLGVVDLGELSLPLFTLVLAGLDAFNPCAFFVLFFLLSLMVHARSRARMLLVGGTFVLFSGLVYFFFMAAWLNLFLVVGGAAVLTTLAGLVALLIGTLNIKDYFWFRQGPTLAIPQRAKPGLFARMRALLAAERLGAMLLGTLVLALAANSYELLCTAGFPMVYTRILTLNDLSASHYYAYLALYNLVYVLPLLAIVLLFTFTLGARKLSERQGRVLKLLSGTMMLCLGLVMLGAPDWLVNPLVGVLLLALAGGVTLLVIQLDRSDQNGEGASR
ncbi:MAG: hypothetical protein EOM91_08265 [Sphingobacteriia bacterium]|nr:hypothetical protein [Sphingobacteriia bacterium]NCC39715.1 hypothetical protein [Gammaproteobacteria bacterium]